MKMVRHSAPASDHIKDWREPLNQTKKAFDASKKQMTDYVIFLKSFSKWDK